MSYIIRPTASKGNVRACLAITLINRNEDVLVKQIVLNANPGGDIVVSSGAYD